MPTTAWSTFSPSTKNEPPPANAIGADLCVRPQPFILEAADAFTFDVPKTLVGFIDINVSTGAIATMKKVGKVTAWSDVPTPAI